MSECGRPRGDWSFRYREDRMDYAKLERQVSDEIDNLMLIRELLRQCREGGAKKRGRPSKRVVELRKKMEEKG